MEEKIYLYEACRRCKNWLAIKIIMESTEGDKDITVYRCKYNIPEILKESETNFIGIKACSMLGFDYE